jgi:hypothetical protein
MLLFLRFNAGAGKPLTSAALVKLLAVYRLLF